MEVTTNKCIGCIYYTKINTYTTSPSTTRDELVEKYGEYYTCSKPYTVRCPREELPNSVIYPTDIQIITRDCIICGKSTSNAEEMICDECKEAIKKLKERLKNE